MYNAYAGATAWLQRKVNDEHTRHHVNDEAWLHPVIRGWTVSYPFMRHSAEHNIRTPLQQ